MKVTPAGSKVTKDGRAAFKKQSDQLRTVVRSVYTALLNDRGTPRSKVLARFDRRAGRAFLRSSSAGSKGRVVRIHDRRARIGLDPASNRHAAARVRLALTQVKKPRKLRIEHRATLWLQRSRAGWRVIAFELDERRA